MLDAEIGKTKKEEKVWVDPSREYVEGEGTDEEKAEEYEAWLRMKAVKEIGDARKALEAGEVTTSEQRLAQPNQPFSTEGCVPLRMPLRGKKVKKCKDCDAVLVKPEAKASATRLKIKMLAR